jgi:hypothetical protein
MAKQRWFVDCCLLLENSLYGTVVAYNQKYCQLRVLHTFVAISSIEASNHSFANAVFYYGSKRASWPLTTQFCRLETQSILFDTSSCASSCALHEKTILSMKLHGCDSDDTLRRMTQLQNETLNADRKWYFRQNRWY